MRCFGLNLVLLTMQLLLSLCSKEGMPNESMNDYIFIVTDKRNNRIVDYCILSYRVLSLLNNCSDIIVRDNTQHNGICTSTYYLFSLLSFLFLFGLIFGIEEFFLESLHGTVIVHCTRTYFTSLHS